MTTKPPTTPAAAGMPQDDSALVAAMYEAVQRTCFSSEPSRLVKDVATDGMRAALAVVRSWPAPVAAVPVRESEGAAPVGSGRVIINAAGPVVTVPPSAAGMPQAAPMSQGARCQWCPNDNSPETCGKPANAGGLYCDGHDPAAPVSQGEALHTYCRCGHLRAAHGGADGGPPDCGQELDGDFCACAWFTPRAGIARNDMCGAFVGGWPTAHCQLKADHVGPCPPAAPPVPPEGGTGVPLKDWKPRGPHVVDERETHDFDAEGELIEAHPIGGHRASAHAVQWQGGAEGGRLVSARRRGHDWTLEAGWKHAGTNWCHYKAGDPEEQHSAICDNVTRLHESFDAKADRVEELRSDRDAAVARARGETLFEVLKLVVDIEDACQTREHDLFSEGATEGAANVRMAIERLAATGTAGTGKP